MAEIRYIVEDVATSVAFYTEHLGFALVTRFGPAMAILERGDLTLWLAGPLASASRPMSDGAVPGPGGWARFVLRVEDLAAAVADLKAKGVGIRGDIVSGPGGRQCLCMDPSGNPIELFEPA